MNILNHNNKYKEQILYFIKKTYDRKKTNKKQNRK